MVFPLGFFDFFEYHNFSQYNQCALHILSQNAFKVSQAVFWSGFFYDFF